MAQTVLKNFLNFTVQNSIPITLFIIVVYAVSSLLGRSALKGKIPPGPPRQLFRLNKSSGLPPWKAFSLLQRKYGPVVSVYQGSTLLVVLGTIKAATDLLEKKGSIYSSRPRNIMASELMSGGMRGLSMQYGTRWRNWRSLMHAGMSIEASNGYKTLQSIESKILLHDLLVETDRERHALHLRRFAISIVFCVSYGRRVESLDDPLVLANMETDKKFISYSTPGKYIVESWPILLKLPPFFQWFRREPMRQRASDTQLYVSLMNEVSRQMDLGLARPSTARRALEKQEDFGLSELETAFALSAPFSAGVGTTLATLDVFFLAMLHHPSIMKRAQAELDSVVGSHRLPEFEDAESLPYIRAVIKETMRWRPIAPLGVPHSVIADDEYEGMRIPNGTTVFASIYSMSKDEEMFPSPEEFNPDRYLQLESIKNESSTFNSPHSNPPHSSFFFGFGRRICPGMHVAQNSLFIVITRMLWAFDILPLKDDSGNAILPSSATENFVGGLVLSPPPFTFALEPRNQRDGEPISSVIQEEWKRAEEEAAGWM